MTGGEAARGGCDQKWVRLIPEGEPLVIGAEDAPVGELVGVPGSQAVPACLSRAWRTCRWPLSLLPEPIGKPSGVATACRHQACGDGPSPPRFQAGGRSTAKAPGRRVVSERFHDARAPPGRSVRLGRWVRRFRSASPPANFLRAAGTKRRRERARATGCRRQRRSAARPGGGAQSRVQKSSRTTSP